MFQEATKRENLRVVVQLTFNSDTTKQTLAVRFVGEREGLDGANSNRDKKSVPCRGATLVHGRMALKNMEPSTFYDFGAIEPLSPSQTSPSARVARVYNNDGETMRAAGPKNGPARLSCYEGRQGRNMFMREL